MPTPGNITPKCRRCLQAIASAGPSTAAELNARHPTAPDHQQTLKAAQQSGYVVAHGHKPKKSEPARYALTTKAHALLAEHPQVATLAVHDCVPTVSALKKTSNFLKGSDQLSQKARLAMRMPPCAPRVRQPGEATPTIICNATTPSSQPYRLGDGEVLQAIRPGAAQAMAIKSHGVRT